MSLCWPEGEVVARDVVTSEVKFLPDEMVKLYIPIFRKRGGVGSEVFCRERM